MVLFIHDNYMMCDNYDAGCPAHHIIVVMDEQHHVHWWSFWISTCSLLC